MKIIINDDGLENMQMRWKAARESRWNCSISLDAAMSWEALICYANELRGLLDELLSWKVETVEERHAHIPSSFE